MVLETKLRRGFRRRGCSWGRAQRRYSGVALPPGWVGTTTARDSVVAAEAEALHLALDLFPILDRIAECDRVAALKVGAEFLVVERPGVNAFHKECRRYHTVNNSVKKF